ncbi:tigger transposable element-derived protein 6-like [Rhipicephalus sanguineus]|uniref:tigger transposable element-derived protein 6-like n=1 Tax=Rhipicephalus sanguineus TaxID=34632 RepID=UPI001894DC56|nr:tigger transposable element-derived protein 6-like [Rhipicephalus sanguineus]
MTGEIFRKWLTDFDKETSTKKRKVLLLLDICSAHHVNAHLRAVKILFLPPDTTAKMQPMDQGVIASFKVHCRRRVIERRLIDIRTADNAVDLKVPLVKAVFFASGAWRDVKSETILHCFEKAGFSRGSSAAEEITPEADIDAAAADGGAAVTSLGQL